MRIGKQGSSGFDGEGRDFSSEKRRQAFRRNHVPGQEVEGRVLKNLGSGLFWLDVSGLELSAQLPFEAAPGQLLLLQIESFDPDIVLKFVKQIYGQLHGRQGGVQVQAYTAMRGGCDAAWEAFLQNELVEQGLQSSAKDADNLENSLPVELGEAFPTHTIVQGEREVSFLHDLWTRKFIPRLEGKQVGDQAKKFNKEFGSVHSIQKSHIATLHKEELRAWLHVPWSGLGGREKEALLIQETGQRLEKLLLSGVWPKIGGAMITALCMDGEISLRVNVQGEVLFEQASLILNLPGLGEVLRVLKREYELPAWPETRRVTCLEYRQRPPDTVAGMILRMQA